MENNLAWANIDENFHYTVSAITLWMLDRSDQTVHCISRRHQAEAENLQSPEQHISRRGRACQWADRRICLLTGHIAILWQCTEDTLKGSSTSGSRAKDSIEGITKETCKPRVWICALALTPSIRISISTLSLVVRADMDHRITELLMSKGTSGGN